MCKLEFIQKYELHGKNELYGFFYRSYGFLWILFTILTGVVHSGLACMEPRDKATNCDWLVATTNVVFARTLTTKVFQRAYIGNKSLTDSIFESARRLLSWSGQQKTNVLANLKAGVH